MPRVITKINIIKYIKEFLIKNETNILILLLIFNIIGFIALLMVGDIFEANDLVVVTTLGINELYIENKKYDNKCFNLISSILYQFKDYLNVDPKRMIIIMCLVITITIIIRLLQLFKLLNKNSKLSFIYRLLSSYANMSSIGGIYLLFKETFNSS